MRARDRSMPGSAKPTDGEYHHHDDDGDKDEHHARSVLRWRRAKPGTGPGWTGRLLARRPANVVLAAMASKTARVAWALLRYERITRPTPA